jgi:hypothetical protein
VEAHLPEGKLTVVCVRCKILKGMLSLAEASKCLAKILLVALAVSTAGIQSPIMNAAS